MKKVKLYLVTDTCDLKDFKIEHNHIFTLTSNKKEADFYIMSRLLSENETHYNLWAINHCYDPRSLKTWARYMKTVLTVEDLTKYFIIKLEYRKEDLAELLRHYIGCSAPKVSVNNFINYLTNKQY